MTLAVQAHHPVSDHPKSKYQDLVVAYESRNRGGLFRQQVWHFLIEESLSHTFSYKL